MASQFVFDAIGTHWIIDIVDECSQEKESSLFVSIMERINIFDAAYSRFKGDSLVSEMSRSPGTYRLPDDAQEMFAVYKTLYDLTSGLVTPLIGQTLVDAGYDATYSLVQKRELVHPIAWDEAMTFTHPHLYVHVPVLLDFGAGGKGYLVDLVGKVLLEHGIKSFCVDAGGDMMHRSIDSISLSVGLEHPDNENEVIGVVSLLNQSLCGSAGNRRVWGDFHHIINPETLQSPRHIRAVWVIAENTLVADSLTTALYFTSPAILLTHFTFEYFILWEDYSFQKSEGFEVDLFT